MHSLQSVQQVEVFPFLAGSIVLSLLRQFSWSLLLLAIDLVSFELLGWSEPLLGSSAHLTVYHSTCYSLYMLEE